MIIYTLFLTLSDGSSLLQGLFASSRRAIEFAEKMSEAQLKWETFGDDYFLGHDFTAGETWEVSVQKVIEG